jgi:predicted nicotinamide N-methyase
MSGLVEESIPWSERDTAKAMNCEELYAGVTLKKGNALGYFQDLTCDVEYKCISGRLHRIKQQLPSAELAPLFSDVWTGSCVWECSLLTCRMFETKLKDQLDDKSVLELGAGCGLAATVACSECHVRSYTATDRGGMVDLAAANANSCLTKEERSKLSTLELSWAEKLDDFSMKKGGQKNYDVIIASDVINPIYGSESWPALAQTISYFSTPKTLIILAYEQRESEGRIEEDCMLNYFFEYCAEHHIVKDSVLLAEGDCRFIFILKKEY